jgi:uncharacterized OsmC-like protein
LDAGIARLRRRSEAGFYNRPAVKSADGQNGSVSAAAAAIRRYGVEARSTDVFGRVLCDCRDHHFVVDGPVHNGCPGEEVTPAELFLAGIATCGVELLQVFAREEGVPLERAGVAVSGEIEPGNPVRPDVTLFNRVHLSFRVAGVTEDEAAHLVERFKGR